MPKEKMQKVTLNLYDGDFATLQGYYAEVGASIVIRKLVRKHIEELEKNRKVPKVEIDA